jgi:S-adenosylmethionine synthetase
MSYVLTSESVTEGHPEKICDLIADSILDACLERDPASRVTCEVLCKDDLVVLAGEITCKESVDYEAIAVIGHLNRSSGTTKPAPSLTF